MIADLTHFWHWSPHDAWSLTGTQLMWWFDQTNRIIERENARALDNR